MAAPTTEEPAVGVAPRDPYQPLTAAHQATLRALWPDGARLWAGFLLARDVDTLAALLRGQPVAAECLNEVPLVRLEVCGPGDLFAIEAA